MTINLIEPDRDTFDVEEPSRIDITTSFSCGKSTELNIDACGICTNYLIANAFEDMPDGCDGFEINYRYVFGDEPDEDVHCAVQAYMEDYNWTMHINELMVK